MISIYINYFAKAGILNSDVLKPIQVGAALSDAKLGIQRDDEGDNISDRNPAYCEMTGIYWAWKNDLESDVLGFMHYRRYFDFLPNPSREVDRHGLIQYPSLDAKLVNEFGLTHDVMEEAMDGVDMIIPVPFDVRQTGSKDIYSHYKNAPHHHIEDLETARRIVEDLSPSYTQHFDDLLKSPLLYPNNMFLFTRPVFEEYCEWLFPILDRLHNEIDTTEYSWQEARAVGYLAERLFSVFIRGQIAQKPDLKFKQLERVFVANTAPAPVEPELPQTDKKVLTVVAACDAAYVPHLGTLIRSIFTTTSPDYFIDMIVLDGGLHPTQRRLLDGLRMDRADSSISFINMEHQHLDLKTHSYFTKATFFRLGLPDLLAQRDKILFLDTDMVVVDDISPLIELDLDNALIAAAPDFVMRAFVNMGVPSIAETGSLKSADYITEHLEMKPDGKSPADAYFQAGTIVMDLAGLRDAGVFDNAIKDLASKTYWFLDQDVLNKHLQGKVKFLAGRWNVLWMDEHHASSLSPKDRSAYNSTFEHPAIIHYAGIGKPWLNSFNPLSHYYWDALRKTPWYETILFSFLDKRYAVHQAPVPPSFARKAKTSADKAGAKIWHALPHALKVKLWPIANRVKKALN
ncbi:lipopolysaccharide biosynthesis glycosyltransferase [Pacificibacter maritimus]|uniref:Lipopolysaccharide biosynthesis glycosyltransferase n=2 Tax=Pacificibacter maritimus TaxID=762213 RepID=A0A3N4U6M3_9RHOB|nr:lipopolysaccharide biosynthesis glycosyltransferase [Pacificibacter maritimus]